nr:putative ankyrin repeat domain-containing protein 20A3 isoform X31 [Oryctolagus cuniculus]XP_051688429.1 putative ankyrin repeat domain-containing protein 20A3 isoform X32 [Oryctolagus cuniculus]XP_051688431.1 putative ankyrin repeat domain-containing protein 20A3 isoform X34 [Oryctolagus cuniculus]
MEKFFSWSVRKFERKPAWTVTEFEKKHLKRRPHFGYRLLYWELGAIHRAASTGNVAAVEKILGCRRSGVDDVDHKSRTALHWACAKGHQDMVAFLISRRCLLDPQDKRAATPLIKAVQCPAENCATLLLDHGADPNIEDEIGNTALHYAAYGGNTRMAEKLLSSNADIEKKNETGLTPLLVAIQQNQESMVKFLILQNADVFAIDNLHRTSLMFAGWYNTEDIVHMLLELGVDVLSEDIAGHSARDYALQKRSMQNYQLISLFRENAVLEKTVNTNPDDEHSKEYRKRLLEIPDVNHELLISYEEGLNSFAKKDLIIPGRTTAIIHSAPEEQPNNDRITRVHGVHEDNKCGSEDEAKESTLDPEEGTSTLAGKKSKKRFFITQVAPQQPINKYGMDSDHGLDKDNKHNKESTSQRDPEDSKSQKNSKEGTSTLAGKKSKKRFFITQVAPQQPIMNSDHGLDKDNKCNKESTSQRDPEDSKSQKNSKTISTNSWKKSINQSMAADAKRKDMNEPLEEFAKGSTELTPRLEAIHPFWTTSVGMNEVQTCRQDNDIKTTNKEEQEWLDGSKNKQFEEKEQRCQSKEMEVLRNLHESAAPPDDSDGCGLNQQRKSGDLDNQQSATKKNEEYYFCPALHIKETKNENEKVTSMEYGIRPVIENGFSLTRSLLQVIYDNNLSELDRLKREQLRRKEKQYHKEVVVKQLEVTHRTLELDARTSKNNLTQFQESEDEQKELVQNTEKIQDHLEKHDQENHELKDTILKQAREIKNLQEILFRLSSVDMKHLQQQQDDIEKRQCKSEASLREMAQFYLKLNSKMQDIMNKLDEIIRKFQVSENLHQGVVENVKKTQDYLEHYNSRLQSEILEMKDIVKLHAGSIEELQKNLIRPSSVDVKHLQQQHDELQQRQSKSEASLEDMACFYYKLNNKTKDIMDELGEINRKFQEAAALHQEEVQNARKLQDHLEHYNARLKYENSLLKDTIKVQANRIEEQQKYLIRPSSVSPDNVRRCCMNSETEIQKLKKELSDLRRQFKDEQQHIMLLAELNQALQDKLDEEMKKNGDLGDKITQPALCCGPGVQWRMAQVLGPCTPGETRRSAWLLPSDQHGAPATVRQPRRPLEGEPTKKTSCQKSSEYLMESDDISKSIQKEHRIHVGISTLSKMKAPQEAISKELDEYKQLLLEGFEDLRRKQDEIIQVAKAFSKQVNEVNEVLAEVRTKNFLLEKQQTGTLTKSVTTQTSVASHSVGNCANSFWLSRDLTPQQNLETPTSATQASHHNTAESLDTFALQDLDTSTSWGRSFQNTEQYRSQQNFFFMPE